MVEKGQIVKNLIPSEPVTINKVQKLGSMVSLAFTGVNTNTRKHQGNFFDGL